MFDRISTLVEELVRTRFDNNQTKAARALDCSPGSVSAMINKTRGPGLNTMLALRHLTGRSIDELLGLDPTPADQMVRELRQSVEAHLLAQLAVKEGHLKSLNDIDTAELARRKAATKKTPEPKDK